jgi:hypothetical protein
VNARNREPGERGAFLLIIALLVASMFFHYRTGERLETVCHAFMKGDDHLAQVYLGSTEKELILPEDTPLWKEAVHVCVEALSDDSRPERDL